MSASCKPLSGWHRTRGALSFAHRWHTKDLADGQNWAEADCAVGIVVRASNLEAAQPGNAVCAQCWEATMYAVQDDLVAIARGLAIAKVSGLSSRVPAPSWMFDLAESIMEYLPPESPRDPAKIVDEYQRRGP